MRPRLIVAAAPVLLFLFRVGLLLGAPDAHGLVDVAMIATAVLTTR